MFQNPMDSTLSLHSMFQLSPLPPLCNSPMSISPTADTVLPPSLKHRSQSLCDAPSSSSLDTQLHLPTPYSLLKDTDSITDMLTAVWQLYNIVKIRAGLTKANTIMDMLTHWSPWPPPPPWARRALGRHLRGWPLHYFISPISACIICIYEIY